MARRRSLSKIDSFRGKLTPHLLFKESKISLNSEIELLGYKDYQGIQNIQQNS